MLFQAPPYLPILEQAAASRTKGEVEEERSPLTDPLSGCRRGGGVSDLEGGISMAGVKRYKRTIV